MAEAWQQTILHTSQEPWPTWVAEAWIAVLNTNLDMSHRQRQQWRQEYANQFVNLEEAEIGLQEDWCNISVREALNEAQFQLQTARHQKLDTKFHCRASNWIRIADHCNVEFFELYSHNKPPLVIRKLNHNGSVLIEQGDLLKHATEFFKTLYIAP